MTLEEAKDILKKEFAVINLHKSTEPFEFDDSNWFGYEKPSVLEAFRVLSKEGYYITISGHDYDMRKKRLEKEYEKNTKAPGSGEEQSKEGDLKVATKMFGAQAREIMRLTAENAELRETIDKVKEGNPALKEALKESATQFNDALLDEQAKKIKSLVKDITHMDNVIYKKNLEIEELTKEKLNLEDQITVLNACKKHNDKIDRKQIKCLGKEIAKQNSIIHDKNAVLSDVTEELRLSKIREKNLTEVSQRYMKENEELREKVAEKTKLVEMVRNGSKEYCDYGVAANDFIKELAHLYVLADKNGNINVEMLERCKNYQTYGFPANCNRETKKEINDIARGKTKVVGVDIAEEGEDHSGITVLCGKDFIDAIKKMK